jgi:hypothetical protein
VITCCDVITQILTSAKNNNNQESSKEIEPPQDRIIEAIKSELSFFKKYCKQKFEDIDLKLSNTTPNSTIESDIFSSESLPKKIITKTTTNVLSSIGRDKIKLKPTFGTGDVSTALKTITPPIPLKQLFISRLDPSTTESDIVNHLESKALKPIKVTRLKTKYPTYSSFSISCDLENITKLNKPDIWPTGTLIMPLLTRSTYTPISLGIGKIDPPQENIEN